MFFLIGVYFGFNFFLLDGELFIDYYLLFNGLECLEISVLEGFYFLNKK